MVGGMQLYQHHSNSQNHPHDQGKTVHGDARSRTGESGNGDIPTSNIHIQDVSVITLNAGKIHSQAHRNQFNNTTTCMCCYTVLF